MLSISIGQRYERLLFAAAPISLAAIIVCIVATASSTQKERVDARCYMKAAQVFSQLENRLNNAWNKPGKKDQLWYSYYKLELNLSWIEGSGASDCYSLIDGVLDEDISKKSPKNIIQEMIDRAGKLNSTPLSAYGITLPKEASVNLVVTDIKVDFLLLTRILQVVLLPVILLWLGSLYATRYRESLLIGSAESLASVFPHIINMYPAFDQPSFKKPTPLGPYVKPFICTVFAVTRMSLLLIFIAPPVFSYLYSLYLGASESYSHWYLVVGVVVSLFTFTTLMAELLPMHYGKVFPDPKKHLRL